MTNNKKCIFKLSTSLQLWWKLEERKINDAAQGINVNVLKVENEYWRGIHLLKYLNKNAILDILANKMCHNKYPLVQIYSRKPPISFQIYPTLCRVVTCQVMRNFACDNRPWSTNVSMYVLAFSWWQLLHYHFSLKLKKWSEIWVWQIEGSEIFVDQCQCSQLSKRGVRAMSCVLSASVSLSPTDSQLLASTNKWC